MDQLGSLTWPEVRFGSVLAVPFGSCEQHGPHLPMDTDTRIARACAETLAERSDGIVVAPAVAFGSSGEHQSFPGTISIGTAGLEAVAVELVRSALPAAGTSRPKPFAGVVIVNGHGGNVEGLARAAALLASEGRDVLVWHPRIPYGDSHAGRTETSLMLHLAPETVRTGKAEPGSGARWRDISELVRTEGLAAVTANGVLGDPTGASASEGAELFGGLVDSLCEQVQQWRATLGR